MTPSSFIVNRHADDAKQFHRDAGADRPHGALGHAPGEIFGSGHDS
jgi:hypothetical protein